METNGSENDTLKNIEGVKPSETENNDPAGSNILKLEMSKEVIKGQATRNKLLGEYIENEKQNRGQRKTYAILLYIFLSIYMAFVGGVLVSCGCENVPFSLSNEVIITLITTTTANVIGIFLLVVRYLFNTKSNKDF